MLRSQLLSTSVIVSIAGLVAAPAIADVTAADVWANTQAFYAATGAAVSGSPRVDGDAVVVDDGSLLYTLPFGAGTFTATLPPLRLIENGDGTVTMADVGSFDVQITMNIAGEAPVSATINMSQTEYFGSVRGTPEEMVYDYGSGSYEVTLTDISLPEEDLVFDMSITGGGYTAVTTITTGDLIEVNSVSTTAPLSVDYKISASDGFDVTSNATYEAGTAEYDMALLANGANILNLTPALAAGMMMRYDARSAGNTSRSTTVINGEVMSDQSIETGDTIAQFSLSEAGLDLSATAASVLMSIVQADLMPFPINAEMTALSAGYSFPVVASIEPQDFSFDLVLDGLRLSPEIWALFDPNKGLPRDPANVALNLTGTTISDVDLFDFMALEQKFTGSVPPVSLQSLSVRKIALAAIGASIDGSAELTFDNTDLVTYDGLPRPEGDAFFEVDGANALLDRLLAVGLLGEDEANAARFGMGFFARSTGDDSFETTVEFGEDGSLSVNGQRIR